MGDAAAESGPPLGDRVAAAVMERYARLNVKDASCWTVVAGVVAVFGASEAVEVVSVASGCKCVGGLDRSDGSVVRDGHAEVVAVRGLRRALVEDAALYERLSARDCVLWMFCSAPPCGDCAIFELETGEMAFTGAKLGDWRREDVQVLGAPRLKCGRSDTARDRRSTSLSCSDKLRRWAALGLQGAVLRHLFPAPLVLGALVVARQPGAADASLLASLGRNFSRAVGPAPRGAAVRPRLEVTGVGAALAAGRGGKTPSSLAVPWWRGGAGDRPREVLIAHRGVLRGATKARGSGASLLCSDCLFQAAGRAVEAAPTEARPPAFVVGDRAATKRQAPRRAADVAAAADLRRALDDATVSSSRKRPRSPEAGCALA